MKKREKKDDWDDGRVVAPMNGDELPSYRRMTGEGRTRKRVKTDLTRKERRSMTRAMFAVMLPKFLIILLGFGIAILLIVLWLS